MNHKLGTKRTVSSEVEEIKVQLKGVSCSSLSMFEEREHTVKYTLKDKLIPIGANNYLVIVQLPPENELDKWLEVSSTETILRKCVYYYPIPRPSLGPCVVEIPKRNLLTSDSLPSLFISTKDKEELY